MTITIEAYARHEGVSKLSAVDLGESGLRIRL
jgi:hypothetical protein